MLKRIIAATMVLATVAAVQAAKVPFSDPFASGGPAADWATDTDATFNNGTLSVVSSDVDWRGITVNSPAVSDGFFGKLAWAPAAAGTAWRLVGDGSEQNYTIEAKVFAPVVNQPNNTSADDYLYQILFFNVNANGYCRFHFQLNQGTAIAAPRIRIQSTYGGFFTPVALASPGDFTLAEKWWDVKLVINNTASTVETFLDGVSKGVGDFSTRPDFATGGKFGFGQYIDDPVAVDRTVYVDAFTVTSNADVADWSAYE